MLSLYESQLRKGQAANSPGIYNYMQLSGKENTFQTKHRKKKKKPTVFHASDSESSVLSQSECSLYISALKEASVIPTTLAGFFWKKQTSLLISGLGLS